MLIQMHAVFDSQWCDRPKYRGKYQERRSVGSTDGSTPSSPKLCPLRDARKTEVSRLPSSFMENDSWNTEPALSREYKPVRESRSLSMESGVSTFATAHFALLDPALPIDEPIRAGMPLIDSSIWTDLRSDGAPASRPLTAEEPTAQLDSDDDNGAADSNSPDSYSSACYVWSDVTTTESVCAYGADQNEAQEMGSKNVRSFAHDTSRCKPCAFFHRDEGCQNADNCDFCHLCPPGEIKRRKKEKALHKKQEAMLRKAPHKTGVSLTRRPMRAHAA